MAISKQRLVLRFPADSVNEPITYILIKEYDVRINILNADITPGKEGNLLIELSGEKESVDRARDYLKKKGVDGSLPSVVRTIPSRAVVRYPG